LIDATTRQAILERRAFARRAFAFQHGDGGRWRCLRVSRLRGLRPLADDWQSGHGPWRQRACVGRVEVSAW